jgi:hypothetical protein
LPFRRGYTIKLELLAATARPIGPSNGRFSVSVRGPWVQLPTGERGTIDTAVED